MPQADYLCNGHSEYGLKAGDSFPTVPLRIVPKNPTSRTVYEVVDADDLWFGTFANRTCAAAYIATWPKRRVKGGKA
ncbi:hypothetical protein D9M70_403460 [compost metagenome]